MILFESASALSLIFFETLIFILFCKHLFSIVSAYVLPSLRDGVWQENENWRLLYESHKNLVVREEEEKNAMKQQEKTLCQLKSKLQVWRKRDQERRVAEKLSVDHLLECAKERRVRQVARLAQEEKIRCNGRVLMKHVKQSTAEKCAGLEGQKTLHKMVEKLLFPVVGQKS